MVLDRDRRSQTFHLKCFKAMGREVDLLRMLEPAVRPGNLPAPRHGATPPIEARSFESLLEEAQTVPRDEGHGPPPAKTSEISLMTQLAQHHRVENPILRQMLAGP